MDSVCLEELDGCELGTKEYWEDSYAHEIKNYRDHGDVGQIWFDEDSQIRIINWITKEKGIDGDSTIIDLGCGNGMFLVELARKGFKNLLGVDYSVKAIVLAKAISNDQDLQINYKQSDLLDVPKCTELGVFNVIHDKGTYDAISLCPVNPKEKRELYLESVYNMMDVSSVFLITSCNWTEYELKLSFEDKFVKECVIPTPTFKFGGKVGSVVTSMVFKKKIKCGD